MRLKMYISNEKRLQVAKTTAKTNFMVFIYGLQNLNLY